MSTLNARLFLLLLLLAPVFLFAACSFSVNYVVVNDSDAQIQVLLVAKKLPHGLVSTEPPAELGLLNVSELDDHKPWRHLQTSQFTFDAATRTVVVTLMPQEALRVDQQGDVHCGDKRPSVAERFRIEEISISGVHGSIRLEGNQAYSSFVGETKSLCTLTYR